MEQLAARNRSWEIDPTDYKTLYQYLAVQKITYLLYDDELYEGLVPVDQHQVMGVSESTVKREWRLAKAWLNHELTDSKLG